MIHTFEIIHQIHTEDEVLRILSLFRDDLSPSYEKAVKILTRRLILDEGQKKKGTFLEDCNKLVPTKEYDLSGKSVRINSGAMGLGFNNIRIQRICNKQYRTKKRGVEYAVILCYFHILLEVNPRTLTNPRDTFTIALYQASRSKNNSLANTFRLVMRSTLCQNDERLSYLCDLQSWNCHRIDYSLNMNFKTAEEKRLFWELTHKTSSYNRTKRKQIKNVKMMDQSAAEGNKSYKSLFYDKLEECMKTYKGIPNEKLLPLLREASNVIRMEHQIGKEGTKKVRERHGFPDRSIIHFLSEEVALNELLLRYDKMVGPGDFYHREEAKRIIRKKVKSGAMQDRLIQLLELLAQKRHLDKAREYFTCANPPTQQRNFPLAHGTQKTFNERIKKIRALGINPMLITDRCKLRHMKNPRYILTKNQASMQ